MATDLPGTPSASSNPTHPTDSLPAGPSHASHSQLHAHFDAQPAHIIERTPSSEAGTSSSQSGSGSRSGSGSHSNSTSSSSGSSARRRQRSSPGLRVRSGSRSDDSQRTATPKRVAEDGDKEGKPKDEAPDTGTTVSTSSSWWDSPLNIINRADKGKGRAQSKGKGISKRDRKPGYRYRGHRRDSFRTLDVDELTELRARQRTFDGAYMRTALSMLSYALLILKIFSPEFARLGLVYIAVALAIFAIQFIRRRRLDHDFADELHPERDSLFPPSAPVEPTGDATANSSGEAAGNTVPRQEDDVKNQAFGSYQVSAEPVPISRPSAVEESGLSLSPGTQDPAYLSPISASFPEHHLRHPSGPSSPQRPEGQIEFPRHTHPSQPVGALPPSPANGKPGDVHLVPPPRRPSALRSFSFRSILSRSRSRSPSKAKPKPKPRLWGREFRTNGDAVVLMTLCITALEVTLIVLLVKL